MPSTFPKVLPLAVALCACSADPSTRPVTDAGPDHPAPGLVAEGGRPVPGAQGDPGVWGDTARDTGADPVEDTDPDPAPDSGTPAACGAWGEPEAVGRVEDDALDEISDLVPSRANPGVLWVHEDSGAGPVLTALDPSGATIGKLTLDAPAVDWEDLAVAPCEAGADVDCLWVGDVGDNALRRDDVAVLRVPEPVVDGPFAATATPDRFPVSWPGGRNNVEGLAVGPDALPWLVTKRVDGTAEVYRFDALDGSPVRLVGTLRTGSAADEHPAEATSADLRDGRLLVRTYGHLYAVAVDGDALGDALELPSPDEPQGEAAAWAVDGRGAWLTSEGVGQALWYVGCVE